MSVKIVHAADFHLDSAFGALSAEQARQRRRESRELLTRLSNYVNQNGVDLVLLAGDLFDSDTTYRETLEALSEALGAMQARVFIAPGNHDPYSAKSPYATLSWPENVHVFTSKTFERVELPELQCAIYGAAFTAPVQDESLLAGFRAPEDDFIHLMVLHGDISATESRYDPLTKEQIKESGIDYLALGHTHQFGGFLREGQTTYAYSGCPEGRGFDELGEKGILTGTVERGKAELSFVPFARSRQGHDKFMDICLLRRIDNFFHRCPRFSISNIFPDRSTEQIDILLYQSDLASQAFQCHPARMGSAKRSMFCSTGPCSRSASPRSVFAMEIPLSKLRRPYIISHFSHFARGFIKM